MDTYFVVVRYTFSVSPNTEFGWRMSTVEASNEESAIEWVRDNTTPSEQKRWSQIWVAPLSEMKLFDA